jgi:hypothetical protein
MAFDQQRPTVSRLRAAMKGLRLAVEECNAALNQWNALGSSAFTAYGADASWISDNGDVPLTDVTSGVTSLAAVQTLWDTSNPPPVGPHKTNIAKGGKP